MNEWNLLTWHIEMSLNFLILLLIWICYWSLNIKLKQLMSNYDISCLTRPDLKEEASPDFKNVNNFVPRIFLRVTIHLSFVALMWNFYILQRESNMYPKDPCDLRLLSLPSVLHAKKTEQVWAGPVNRQTQQPRQKLLSLINPPINAKTSRFYAVHCSLYNHTVQAYTTEQVGM